MPAQKPTIVGVVVFLFFVLPFSVFAVSTTILNFPSVITTDPFTITASISGAASGTNYLRVDLYKEGTQNYFGETYNGSDWCSGSSGKEYAPITVQSGKIWSGDIQARIGDISNSNYDGQGTYKIRLRRYTSSGGLGSEEAENSSVLISINVPTSTPTPTLFPTNPPPTNTVTPTSTPMNTSTPTKIPTLTPTMVLIILPTSTPSRLLIEEADESSTAGVVLGETKETDDILGNQSLVLMQKRPYILSLLFVGIGLVLLGTVYVIKIRLYSK